MRILCTHNHTYYYLYSHRVALLTQVGGLAYYATNIFFSAWLALASCVYTLDQWSTAKDWISIDELTGLSATLPSWYALFFCSLTVMCTGANMHIYLNGRLPGETAFTISLGLVASVVSAFFIMVHYKFFSDCCPRVKQGGWLELSIAFFMILFWTIG